MSALSGRDEETSFRFNWALLSGFFFHSLVDSKEDLNYLAIILNIRLVFPQRQPCEALGQKVAEFYRVQCKVKLPLKV